MTHDEQWQVIIDQWDDRLVAASDDLTLSQEKYRSLVTTRLKAWEARRLGENPIIWKLANG